MDVDTTDLMRDFVGWAERKRREPDLTLLDDLLRLRASYDDLEPTFWPIESVEHLLTERWPSKGPVETPEPSVVVETLDAFLRFLRTTGRLSGRSAEVAVLVKEARRSARHMASLADDRANWSINKVLAEFGRTRGIDLDTAPDLEALQERLKEIQDQWNELPVEERRRLSPGLDRPPAHAMTDLTGREQAMEEYGVDDPLIAQLYTYADRLPSGELAGEEVVGPAVREAPYFRQVIALASWVGDGKQITTIGVLRPAAAREAFAALELGGWEREMLHRQYPDERLPGVAAMGLDAWIARELERSQNWRSAADCEELHRLWCGAVASGLITLDGRRVRRHRPLPDSDEEWTNVALRAAVGLADLNRRRGLSNAVLTHALMESYVAGCRPVSKEALREFTQQWIHSPEDRARSEAEDADDYWITYWDTLADEGPWLMGDTGVLDEKADSYTLTPFGDVFVTAWLRYLEDA